MSVIKGLRAATARSPTIRKAVTVGALAASGGLAAGEDVQSVARKLSAVDRCIEVLSDSMAKLPNFVIDNRSREHVPHDILYLLNVRPNEAMTPAINYLRNTDSFEVILEVDKQYWGDVTPYQAQVEALTASVEGKTAELAEKDEQLAKKDEALAAANGLLAELEATYDEN